MQCICIIIQERVYIVSLFDRCVYLYASYKRRKKRHYTFSFLMVESPAAALYDIHYKYTGTNIIKGFNNFINSNYIDTHV